ncbi:MAG: hypothetical protein ACMXYL_02710 [Candidatus Woesearchaeota archaeon]
MGKKLSESDYYRIRRNILKKLYSNTAFSKGHVLFVRLQSGIPRHLSGFTVDVLDDLLRDGLVIYYGKTKYGDAYQLNIKKLDIIERIIFSH